MLEYQKESSQKDYNLYPKSIAPKKNIVVYSNINIDRHTVQRIKYSYDRDGHSLEKNLHKKNEPRYFVVLSMQTNAEKINFSKQ